MKGGHFVMGAALAAIVLSASASEAKPAASATMVDATGKVIGTLTLEETPRGIFVTGHLSDLPPGVHGFHIHDKGACAPTFEAAGPHFNPTGAEHGRRNPEGRHLGDLENLAVQPNGHVRVWVFAPPGATLSGEGPNSLLSGDGTALVVHADPDDERTDPTGNSGARIACGVVE
jgi:superoxide dismutase, Cu-Zn family